MAFRRFGGDWDGGKDSGNISVAIIGVVALVLFCVLALFTNNVGFVLAGFSICGLFGLFAMAKSGSPNYKTKDERFEQYIEAAIACYKKEDIAGAQENYRRAKIYGDPSQDYKWLQDKISNI